MPAVTHADIITNLTSLNRHVLAKNPSPRTIETYCGSVGQFVRFHESPGMPLNVSNLRREHVESSVEHLLEKWKPATTNNQYRGLQAFFKWLKDEREIKDNPIARMKPPGVPESLPDVLRQPDLKALPARCDKSQDFESRRDSALITVFVDTGPRLSEVASLRWNPADDTANDVDLDPGILRVMGNGRRERVLAVGRRSVRVSTDTCAVERSSERLTATHYGWGWRGL